MALQFILPPAALSAILKSVLAFTATTKGQPPRYPHVLLHAERDGRRGIVAVTGFSRALAARDWAPTMGAEGDEVAEVLLVAANPENTELVDDVHKLAQAVGKLSKAADARVFVTVVDGARLTVEYGGQLVGELAAVQVPDSWGSWDRLDGWLSADTQPLAGPTTFLLDTIGRLTKIPGGIAADLAAIPDLPGFVKVAVGPTFRALMATVDRHLFAAGGPWGDGPGTEEHLLDGVPA